MAKITQLAIYQHIESYIVVTNADKSTVTFSIPSVGDDYETIKSKLEKRANDYILIKSFEEQQGEGNYSTTNK